MTNEILDSGDFAEIVLKHLARDNNVLQKAKELKMKAQDFMASEAAGIRIYREIASVILEIGSAPLDKKLLMVHVKERFKSGVLQEHQKDATAELINWMYSSELNSSYVVDNIKAFMRRRRLVKAVVDNSDDVESVYTELNKVAIDLDISEASSKTRTFNPFKDIVLREAFSGLCTGFSQIDKVIGGIGFAEYGLIIGHSGSGKTAVASSIMLYNVKIGKKVLYLSAEEPGENICDRMYANQFKISYTQLHTGAHAAKIELTQAIGELTGIDKEHLINNLLIEDVRHLAPINKDVVINILETKAKEGFLPDMVIIDQMDYQEPVGKYDSKWERYEAVSMENDYLSQHLIAGHKPFALWVLHQATGKMQLNYTNAEISGFKGIIRPTDITMCVGRESPQSEIARLFSLKTRHTKNFELDYSFHGEFMSYEHLPDDKNPYKIKQQQKDEKKKNEKQFRKQPDEIVISKNEFTRA